MSAVGESTDIDDSYWEIAHGAHSESERRPCQPTSEDEPIPIERQIVASPNGRMPYVIHNPMIELGKLDDSPDPCMAEELF